MSAPEQNQRLSRADAVSVSARRRLEGQLEVLERATEIVARAVEQLAPKVRVPRGLSEAVSAQVDAATVKAESAVLRLAAEERSLQAVLKAAARRRAQFQAAVTARAKLLRVPADQPLHELVARFEQEPLVYFQRRGGGLAWLSAALSAVSAVTAALAGARQSPYAGVFVALAVMGLQGVDHWWFSRLAIVLTTRRLCVGRFEFELSSLTQVAVTHRHALFRRRRTKQLVITTKLGRTIELPITVVPHGFAAAVRSVGLDWNEASWW